MEIMSRFSTSSQSSRQHDNKKKLVMAGPDQSRRKAHIAEPAPDLTDFMNDMFFGSIKTIDHNKIVYNLTGTSDDTDTSASVKEEKNKGCKDENKLVREEFSPGRRSTSSSKLSQDWLEEARRLVASSPSRSSSPSRLVGSPRFATAAAHGSPASASASASSVDRRDPLSRSARRYRAVESFSGEILSKSATHSRNKSETFATGVSPAPESPTEGSRASYSSNSWFSDILNPPNPTPTPQQSFEPQPRVPILISRPSLPRKSRFQTDPSSPRPHGIPIPPGRSFQSGPTLLTDTHLLSPPKNLIESAQRRSVSSSTCSVEKISLKRSSNGLPSESGETRDFGLNGFLKEQRIRLGKVLEGDDNAKAKIILSGSSNSTSSMVAAICYAWLLENKVRKESKTKGADEDEYVMVPVMNVKRETMWKLRQAAWLFYHVGLDVNSLFFANEVDLEGLIMTGKLNMLVVGQDVLKINGEVGSQCTILTDNYCEDAYDLLQTPVLKKLLLAAILLDTQNLNSSSQHSMARDAEAVQLLLVGSTPNYRNALFDQLIQDQRDNSFLEALRQNYGKPSEESGHESEEHVGLKTVDRKSLSNHRPEAMVQHSEQKNNAKPNKVSQKSEKPSSSLPKGSPTPPTKANPDASRGKNKFFLAKWFGFGSK
ncbi:uncharacterized protein LOC133830220 [Humulus lupulus]|uniref:uncharacterized protein LOC133830220 n=1 Tax=Humulus lupulus TaxID=3486 RepID=UPI002B413473|nr:uncharacterized protein LOC133830220 [Humulus lupulus]